MGRDVHAQLFGPTPSGKLIASICKVTTSAVIFLWVNIIDFNENGAHSYNPPVELENICTTTDEIA